MLWLKQNKRLKSKKQAINRKEEQEPPAGKRNSRFLLNFMDEILKYAIENGIINPAHVLEEIQMKKNEEILKKYITEITYGREKTIIGILIFIQKKILES